MATQFTMLVGISGSGKSSIAREFGNLGYYVASSDELRIELLGNYADKEHNDQTFHELHKRIKERLRAGQPVVYDATNISRKRRIAFLKEIRSIPCHTTAIMVMCPLDECIDRQALRDMKVPTNAIVAQYRYWQPVAHFEGFDEVQIRDTHAEYRYIAPYMHDTWLDFGRQYSKWHRETLRTHTELVTEYMLGKTTERWVIEAAHYHDCGKPFCRCWNERNIATYHCHENVSAYEAYYHLFLDVNPRFSEAELLNIMELINLHMTPHNVWKDNPKLEERDRKLFGDKMYRYVKLLGEADVAACEVEDYA